MWFRIDTEEDAKQIIGLLESAGMRSTAKRLQKTVDDIKRPITQKLIEAAKSLYECGPYSGDHDIEVDPDAAISESEEHAFVMMWGHVTYEQEKAGTS